MYAHFNCKFCQSKIYQNRKPPVVPFNFKFRKFSKEAQNFYLLSTHFYNYLKARYMYRDVSTISKTNCF